MKVTLVLDQRLAEKLVTLARQERRSARSQAEVLLRASIERAKLPQPQVAA